MTVEIGGLFLLAAVILALIFCMQGEGGDDDSE